MVRSIRKAAGVVLPNPTCYGWWVVGACLLCTALSAPGQSYALALYMEPIADQLGTSRIDVAGVYAWATLAAAVVLPLAGRVADRVSSRFYLGSVIGLMGLSMLLLASVSSLSLLAVAFFALRLLGQGATGLGVLTTVVRWFERHRGRAVAIAMLGYAVGEFVMPTVIVNLQSTLGWRGSLLALGSLYALVLAPMMVLIIRRAPPLDGHARLRPESPMANETTASAAVRMPRFWLLAGLVSVTPFVLTALLLNHVALFDRIGWTRMDVARALQGYAVGSLITTYAVGTLLDRVPARTGVLVSMALLALALLAPMGVRSPGTGVLLYGALLGAAAGATNAVNGVIWPEYFGIGSVGAIKGVVSTVRNGVTAAGAPLGAWLLEGGGGFTTALVAGASLAAIAGCIALFLPAPSRAPAEGHGVTDGFTLW